MSTPDMTAAHDGRCRSTTKAGAPCRMKPGTSGYCYAHDPALAVERAHSASKGGQVRHAVPRADGLEIVPLRDTEAIQQALELAYAETRALGSSVQRSKTLGSLLSLALDVLPRSELEERLQRVEGMLREIQSGHQLQAVR